MHSSRRSARMSILDAANKDLKSKGFLGLVGEGLEPSKLVDFAQLEH
jgi:hypothetical protein